MPSAKSRRSPYRSKKRGLHRRGHRVFHRQFLFEPLERRLLLDGDPAGGNGLPLDDPDDQPIAQDELANNFDDTSGSEAETPAAVDPWIFSRFESAEEFEDFVVERVLERYKSTFGRPVSYWHPYDIGPTYRPDDPMFFATLSDEAAPSHSDTNVQVVGVDEADIVETDGNYLYVIADNSLLIIDALPVSEMGVASRVPITGQPVALYLNGDRLTFISEERFDYWVHEPWIDDSMPVVGDVQTIAAADMAYWPGPIPQPDPQVYLTVLDVSDRYAPQVVQKTNIEGRYVDSRAIDGRVYVAMNNSFALPGPRQIPTGDRPPVQPRPGEPITALYPEENVAETGLVDGLRLEPIPEPPTYYAFYETKEAYLARIEGQVLELALPEFRTFGADGQIVAEGLLTEPTSIFRPLRPYTDDMLTVAAFDVLADTPGPVSSTGVPGAQGSRIYASTENLYAWRGNWITYEQDKLSVLKFDLNNEDGEVELVASGIVPGYALNQFSMDEYNGYLRVATTNSRWFDEGNNVYVLEQHGHQLEIVGRLEELALTEQIYSVRFMEDRAFVVTFRRVDPLFTIDLSDPTNPALVGELKIPGFSNYLQAIDGEHLIGIGRDADPNTGIPGDLQVSLFAVGDLGNPELLDRYDIDTRHWAPSEALTDHHAVAYFPEYQVLAIPVTGVHDWSIDKVRPDGLLQTDMWVFQIDPWGYSDDGGRGDISLLGIIDHEVAVRRTVRIEDLLYTISADMVTAHKIFDPEAEVARLYFEARIPEPVKVANVDVELSVVRTPTPVGRDGRRGRPTPSVEWMDEWDTFWAELWVRSHDGRGVTGGSVDLTYNSEFFTAVEIDHGPVFVGDPSGEIDDVTGEVTAVGGTTRRTDAGGETWVLLGRIRFESLDGDDVPVGESSRPYELGIELTDARFDAFNAESVDVHLGASPSTEVWPVPYDVNDDGRVNFRDLAHFASVFLKDVVHSDSPLVWTCDFDQSGRVDFADLSHLAANFQYERLSKREVRFHADFRQRWAGEEIEIEDRASVDQVLDTAVETWKEAAQLPESFHVQLAVDDLPEGQLSSARILEVNGDGQPVRGRVIIDNDAGGRGWHGDLERPATGDRFDLYAVLVREIGQTLGFPDGLAGMGEGAAGADGATDPNGASWDDLVDDVEFEELLPEL